MYNTRAESHKSTKDYCVFCVDLICIQATMNSKSFLFNSNMYHVRIMSNKRLSEMLALLFRWS